MKWVDLTLPVGSGMVVWPGDPPVAVEEAATIPRDGVALSRLTMGSHTGTHIDAPCHFLQGRRAVDAIEPSCLIGPCRVLDLGHVVDVIRAEDLAPFSPRSGERLLFKTRNGQALRSSSFQPDYVALGESGARLLAGVGVILVGIDALSIEPFRSPGHPVHHCLLEQDIVVLEGLDLAGVEPGPGHLVALPLRLAHGDGAPARVMLGR